MKFYRALFEEKVQKVDIFIDLDVNAELVIVANLQIFIYSTYYLLLKSTIKKINKNVNLLNLFFKKVGEVLSSLLFGHYGHPMGWNLVRHGKFI